MAKTGDKTGRLFAIIDGLRRRRRPVTAEVLADEQGVSVRTLYRDIQALIALGAPIEGAAGVGYVLRPGFFLPPLMFTADELEALVVGTRFVRAFAGDKLAAGAQAALLKIEAVLPPELRERAARTRIYAPVWRDQGRADFAMLIDRLHAAIAANQVLRLDYRDEGGQPSLREVEPLCLAFWGGKWTLGAWCRLRRDFRNFRPDRIHASEATGETFAEAPGRSLDDYLQAVGGNRIGMN